MSNKTDSVAQRLKEIRERRANVTGKWERYGAIGSSLGLNRVRFKAGEDRTGRPEYGEVLPSEKHARFIANAPSDIDYLLSLLDTALPTEPCPSCEANAFRLAEYHKIGSMPAIVKGTEYGAESLAECVEMAVDRWYRKGVEEGKRLAAARPTEQPPQCDEHSSSGRLWHEWFDRVGDRATPSVINATATLVIGERELYAARPTEQDAQSIKLTRENGSYIPEVYEQILIASPCGVAGHLKFQLNGGICMMCQELARAHANGFRQGADQLQQFIRDATDGMECLPECDSYGHAELCPVVNPLAAFRQLRAQLEEQGQHEGSLKKHEDSGKEGKSV